MNQSDRSGNFANKNVDKKANVLKSNKKKFRFELLIPIVIVVVGIFWVSATQTESVSGAYKPVKDRGGIISIPVSHIEVGQAQYYRYSFPDKDVLFSVEQSNNGEFYAAFDTCRAGAEGKEECALGEGCSLTYIDKQVKGSKLLIGVSDLYLGKRLF